MTARARMRARVVAMRAALLATAACMAGVGASPAHAQFPDSLAAWTPTADGGQFSFIRRAEYLRVHAVSLDNYFEFTPGGVVVRAGPIGNVAWYSRWGIGRGRAQLSVNGIPFNDPQDGTAPWVQTATSGVGELRLDEFASGPAWIEGGIELQDAPPLGSRPATFIELSKGANELRQRRVRFASEQGAVGLELSYDEVLDDGYYFDATGQTPFDPDFGRSRSRNSSIVLHGKPDDRATFTFGIRGFESTSDGDIGALAAEATRDGHVAWLDAGVDAARFTVYGRGFKSSQLDSSATNETVGVAFTTRLGARARHMRLRLTGEQTSFVQDVGAGMSKRLLGGGGVLTFEQGIGGSAAVFAEGALSGDEESAPGWSAALGLRRRSERQVVSVQALRAARQPSLAERYLPPHQSDGNTLAGNPRVDPEHALELRGEWEQRTGRVVNNLRVSWMAADGNVEFRPYTVGNETWRVAQNADGTGHMVFVEERLRTEFGIGPLRALADGAVMVSSGDREETFASVPNLQVNGSALLGGEMFEKTSALYAGAEFLHMGERDDFDGRALPAFDVLNLVLEGRLLDVRLYLKYLNVLDQVYATQGDYLMTPGSFCYGIQWTLFD
ncbi:MAG TPA: hypothetical protein VFX92_05840 [Candidatus Krumholzibacteria bacterium]|nr:hypothetical protein [Candidatus Krumholzibacteria bacterium]